MSSLGVLVLGCKESGQEGEESSEERGEGDSKSIEAFSRRLRL